MVKRKQYASISLPKSMAKVLDDIWKDHPERFSSRAEVVKFMINDFLGRNLGYKKCAPGRGNLLS